MEDTIAAISTPIGEGGIAIIRISGPLAIQVAEQIYRSREGRPSDFATHTIHFGTIARNGETVDEVLLSVMRAPRTYTKEDTVEINCHSGIVTIQRILSLCLQSGARLAEPGEFTQRAFLHGRIDLSQAEGVMDLIRARTDRAQQSAIHALQGRLSEKINDAREKLLSIAAHIEAHIDFPEEDISPASRETLHDDTQSVLEFLQSLLATYREGKLLREGLPVAIIGRPNVGKSSLLNALLGENRAIVTPVPGTTRDTVEEYANIKGVLFRFIDTAGIRNPRGRVEKLGVERSSQAIDRAELILQVLDSAKPLRKADVEIYQRNQHKKHMLVLNKCDQPRLLKIPAELENSTSISVSALTGAGLPALCSELVSCASVSDADDTNVHVAINERHRNALERACNSLTYAVNGFEQQHTGLELIAQQLRVGLNTVGEITGRTATEDILNRVFSTFCIGK